MSHHELLVVRAMAQAQAEFIDRAMSHGMPEENSRILSVTAAVLDLMQPRSSADAFRFSRALTAGDEAWLLCRSLPEPFRVEARYYGTLPRECRRLVE